MDETLDRLQRRLIDKNLDLSHVAMRTDGRVLYKVNDVFISPRDAHELARGLTTLEKVQRRNEKKAAFDPQSFAWIAASSALAPIVKTIYDVGKDGWQQLKPSAHLSIDVLTSESDPNGHRLRVRIANLTMSGIYLESVSLAKTVDKKDRLSLNQPTIQLYPENYKPVSIGGSSDLSDRPLPYLLIAGTSHSPRIEIFNMSLPRLLHDGKPRAYGVAELTFSKLNEPAPDSMSFTFRLR